MKQKFIRKCGSRKRDSYFITKCHKIWLQTTIVLLQNAKVLLQNATVITKCDNFITKYDSYYKMLRLLQNAMLQYIIALASNGNRLFSKLILYDLK